MLMNSSYVGLPDIGVIDGNCHFGWTHFGSQCYKFFPQSTNWITAQVKCKKKKKFLDVKLPFLENYTEQLINPFINIYFFVLVIIINNEVLIEHSHCIAKCYSPVTVILCNVCLRKWAEWVEIVCLAASLPLDTGCWPVWLF